MTTTESQIEKDFIEKLEQLKYTYRPDIRDRQYHWRDNRYTRDRSTPVLSY